MPKVSVVMSVFNQEKYLPSAIESILNQSYTDFEFIIVNDGSNDSSNEIILGYKDKRIILIDGEAAGAINRVPPPGEARANIHVGAQAEPADLTDREREICSAIGPLLKTQGLIFVGIDVIGGYQTEINVTSPTGLQEYERFTGTSLSARIWESIEARFQ